MDNKTSIPPEMYERLQATIDDSMLHPVIPKTDYSFKIPEEETLEYAFKQTHGRQDKQIELLQEQIKQNNEEFAAARIESKRNNKKTNISIVIAIISAIIAILAWLCPNLPKRITDFFHKSEDVIIESTIDEPSATVLDQTTSARPSTSEPKATKQVQTTKAVQDTSPVTETKP